MRCAWHIVNDWVVRIFFFACPLSMDANTIPLIWIIDDIVGIRGSDRTKQISMIWTAHFQFANEFALYSECSILDLCRPLFCVYNGTSNGNKLHSIAMWWDFIENKLNFEMYEEEKSMKYCDWWLRDDAISVHAKLIEKVRLNYVMKQFLILIIFIEHQTLSKLIHQSYQSKRKSEIYFRFDLLHVREHS